jgi:prepilin-type N-terminal cleavage/methylation domain-containing protein
LCPKNNLRNVSVRSTAKNSSLLMADYYRLIAGFTLVELMIVVAVLGILAAIALPEFSNHTQKAKESAAKENLHIFRDATQRYALQHNDVPPGYINGNTSANPVWPFAIAQLIRSTNKLGIASDIGTQSFPLGPYIRKIPQNPFNNKTTVSVIANSQSMPSQATGTYGWIYKPATNEIRLDWSGTDSTGIKYYDY